MGRLPDRQYLLPKATNVNIQYTVYILSGRHFEETHLKTHSGEKSNKCTHVCLRKWAASLMGGMADSLTTYGRLTYGQKQPM